MASLETCLSILTRALPSTKLDLVCSLSWNVIRYLLHRPTPLGWLVHQVGGKYKGEEARTSARDAALVYHQLSQLQLTGKWPLQNVAQVLPTVLGCASAPSAVVHRLLDFKLGACFSASLHRKPAPAQQLVGFVSVSERCQPQRECASQNGSCTAHTDICNCSYCPEDCARAPPLHTTCRFKNTEETQKVMYFSFVEFTTQHHPLPPHRVTFWAVQRMLAPNQSPTACTGSSPRWVGSSSWAVIGQWSLRVPVRYTRLRETQVSCRKTRWLDGKVHLTQF